MPKISLYICSSSDGFIADKSGGVSWLPPMGPEAQKHYEEYFTSVSTVIMGSKSYYKVMSFGMEWPYAGKTSWVFSSKKELRCDRDDVNITSEDPKSFVERLGGPPEEKVWLMGGAELIKSFADGNLIDEILLFTVMNKTLGEGIPLGIQLANFDMKSESEIGELKFQEFVKK